jgi:MarR family transcriptional regulator, transcriptional regulator for hemolysin
MNTEPQDRETGGHAEDFGWSLGVLLRAYKSAVTGAVEDLPHGHRGYQILSSVVHDEPPSQLALANHLGIDRTVMTYLLDDLVEAGLVERRPNPADRRQRRIVATETGSRTLTKFERRVQEARDDVLAALAPGERETLCTLVRRAACDVRDIDTREDPCEVADKVLADTQQAVTPQG